MTRIFVIALGMTVVSPLSVSAQESAKAKEPTQVRAADQIKGKWVLHRETPQGRYTTIKQHVDGSSIVTTYDPAKNPVAAHRSEYRVDDSGGANVFRYRNKVVLIGPNKGSKDPTVSEYIFRIEGKTFYEVHGMLPGDKGKPRLVVWHRYEDKDSPKPNG